MEAVHDADLLSNILLVLCGVRLDELSGPDLLRGLLHQLEDLTELPPAQQTQQCENVYGGRGALWEMQVRVGGALRSQPLLHIVQVLHLHVCSDGHISVLWLFL